MGGGQNCPPDQKIDELGRKWSKMTNIGKNSYFCSKMPFLVIFRVFGSILGGFEFLQKPIPREAYEASEDFQIPPTSTQIPPKMTKNGRKR